MKSMKNYLGLFLKCYALLLAGILKQLRNSSLRNIDYAQVIISVH